MCGRQKSELKEGGDYAKHDLLAEAKEGGKKLRALYGSHCANLIGESSKEKKEVKDETSCPIFKHMLSAYSHL